MHLLGQRPWVATWLVIQGLALGLLAVRPPIRELDAWAWITGAVVSALWLLAVATAVSRLHRGRWFVAGLGSAALVSLLAANLRTYLELGEFVTPSMVALAGPGAGPELRDIPSWIAGYLPPVGWFAAVVATLAMTLGWSRPVPPVPAQVGFGAAVAAIVGVLGLARMASVPHLPPDMATFVALASIRDAPVAQPLPPIRRRPVSPTATVPIDVLVVVQESWSRSRLAPYGAPAGAMPSLEARMRAEDGRWFVFDRAYTVATATDLVLEALLTGISPAAPSESRNAAPLLWSFARAGGHETLFVTPQNLAWGSLPAVLDPDTLDLYLGRRELGGRRANDLGTDELLAADALTTELRALPRDRSFVGVYLSNALHEPFQTDSPLYHGELDGPRYSRALRLTDEALARILGALDATGRTEQTLVILVGDHGVTSDRKHALPRLYGFYEEFVHVPLMVRVPESLQSDALAANQGRLVNTLDVLPTVLDTIGQPIPGDLGGHSLLRPVPDDRVVVSVNANDRRRWEHEGFALVWDHWRLLYTNLEGPRLFRVDADPDQRVDRWPEAPPEVRATVEAAVRENPVLLDISGPIGR